MDAAKVLRVIGASGTRLIPLRGCSIRIGSAPDCDVVLSGRGVSSQHCRIDERNGRYVLIDRGARNRTIINGRECTEPTELRDGDALIIGSYRVDFLSPRAQLDITALADAIHERPLLRARDTGELVMDDARRLRRFAREWLEAGRPRRLLLDARDLTCALELQQKRRVERDPVLDEYVDASQRHQRVRTIALFSGVGVLAAALLFGLVLLIPAGPTTPVTGATTGDTAGGTTDNTTGDTTTTSDEPDIPRPARRFTVTHLVRVPGETVQELAYRYGAEPHVIRERNNLPRGHNELKRGTKLTIEATKDPLPRQQYEHAVAPGETWRSLAERYGLTIAQLRRYNPKREFLHPGDDITMWLEPRPLRMSDKEPAIPDFGLDENGRSIGCPNKGRLEGGVLLPLSPSYDRRTKQNSFGATYTIRSLMEAIALFRERYDYDGQLMIGDISRRRGGPYKPHVSHQSGRDIDVWLPVMRGFYRKDCRDRTICRPMPEHVDWYATWALVRALIDTRAVRQIFIDYNLQENLYKAALYLGESEQSLKQLIQYPDSRGSYAIVQHSAHHTHHIHVRFHCDPAIKDDRCRRIQRGECPDSGDGGDD